MSGAYTLSPIHRMPTQMIHFDGEVVGYLYAPDAMEARWEIWARQGCAALRLSGLPEAGVRYFVTHDDAMAFLGLAEERVAA